MGKSFVCEEVLVVAVAAGAAPVVEIIMLVPLKAWLLEIIDTQTQRKQSFKKFILLRMKLE